MPILSRSALYSNDAAQPEHWGDHQLGQALAVRALATMTQRLDLSDADLATMLWNQSGAEITDAMVHAWLSRIVDVPEQLIDILCEDEMECMKLVDMYRPDRLPDIIRRPAPAFGDDSALSFILAGRIAHVARTYDDALSFQE